MGHAANPHTSTTRAGESHGSAKSYRTGFLLSALLTIVPFMLVMYPVLSRPSTMLVLVGFAVAQIVVQLVYFLHMNRSSEGGWNLASFVFTLVILFIVVALSIWIIWSMHFHMMIN
ncbi:cytochrome o ubiquinol oxidase subunit IV [Pigmentiphaga aceris]|uniref:Cytochrome bo(3) ubiquinol oxidase subunit 4 n=1 Tax=Pigmentiphaga aceris TaxID=1940612 RepID=A0A5C0B147_9BURK|nr:cytochrome o ubiquinol oxidase subunit IV [Pigmentiphaga aceris]QEI06377.1 cytochrome o ubiquinol oxidase subunit IV [Pigmentiphaga aceris]